MSQRITKKQKRQLRQDGLIDDEGEFKKAAFTLLPINPMTEAQEDAFDAYNEGLNIALTGCAGTGKSFLAMYFALTDVLDVNSPRDKVVIVRSVVPTRDQGFQQGSRQEKEAHYESPYPPIATELFGFSAAYSLLKQRGMVEFISTSFLRSLTMPNAYVIIDEAQNMTYSELLTVITRAGANTKVIICGDIAQTDLYKHNDKSGLAEILRILERMKSFDTVEFLPEDIVRSGFVREFLQIEYKLKTGKVA